MSDVAHARLIFGDEFVMNEIDLVRAKALLKKHLNTTKELLSDREFQKVAFRKNLITASGELTSLGWKLAEITEADMGQPV